MSCEQSVPEILCRATEHCRNRRELTRLEAEDLASGLAAPGVPDAAKVDFLLAWAAKGETATELAGLARAFLAKAKPAGLMGRWAGNPPGGYLWHRGRRKIHRQYLHGGSGGGGGRRSAGCQTWKPGGDPAERKC